MKLLRNAYLPVAILTAATGVQAQTGGNFDATGGREPSCSTAGNAILPRIFEGNYYKFDARRGYIIQYNCENAIPPQALSCGEATRLRGALENRILDLREGLRKNEPYIITGFPYNSVTPQEAEVYLKRTEAEAKSLSDALDTAERDTRFKQGCKPVI